ncbi:energy transducer TonB [Christiangramia sediminis]|uniref:Energy transducer TonB n=1 Tax=Christiangramia sediminis TaxID=2881336 RepID=A0A9X1RZ00_9FLAO|nr:energy transducer TonB [Christiangramia sediminis]MCB7482299.1 energy transducer TonB [Christiangramia sediminis]
MKTPINYTLSLLFALISIGAFSQDTTEVEAIPFAVVDQVPAFEGCENLEGEEMKNCTVEKITHHVNSNFDTSLGKKLNIQGQTRIVVQFKIDENGNITDVRSRSLADEAEVREVLQNEATRVVSSLPQMQPGKKDGKNVAIMYSLPIAFAVPEKEEKKS